MTVASPVNPEVLSVRSCSGVLPPLRRQTMPSSSALDYLAVLRTRLPQRSIARRVPLQVRRQGSAQRPCPCIRSPAPCVSFVHSFRTTRSKATGKSTACRGCTGRQSRTNANRDASLRMACRVSPPPSCESLPTGSRRIARRICSSVTAPIGNQAKQAIEKALGACKYFPLRDLRN